MKFKDEQHEIRFIQLCESYTGTDETYAFPLFYLVAMDESLWEHRAEIYDFSQNFIEPEALKNGWHTGGSIRALRLGFNLFNGFIGELDEETRDYTIDSLFDYGNTEYFLEAIGLRYA